MLSKYYTKITCAYCQKDFIRLKSRLRAKGCQYFCSRICKDSARKSGIEVYKFKNQPTKDKYNRINKRGWVTRKKNGNGTPTDVTKRKLSRATSKNIANGKICRVSKLEYVVLDLLKKLRIPFSHQHRVVNPTTNRYAACVDFFIPHANTAIEVNGTFWHADTRFYNHDNLYPSQVRTLNKYADKEALLDRLGILLVELWEYDIKTDIKSIEDNLVRLFYPTKGLVATDISK